MPELLKHLIDSEQLPCYVVLGANWHVEIRLDEHNAQFPRLMQMHEAGTRAIEAFKGDSKDFYIQLDEGEEIPMVGPTMVVFEKDTDIKKNEVLLTYMHFADAGYYEEAKKHEQVLINEIKKIQAEEKASQGKPNENPKKSKKNPKPE